MVLMLLSCMKEEVIVTGDALIFYNKSHLLPLTIVGKHIDARSAIEPRVSKNARIQNDTQYIFAS